MQNRQMQTYHFNLKPKTGVVMRICALFVAVSIPSLSFAYIGPGAGITMIGALWAVIIAVVFAVGGLLIWPLRAFLRRKKTEEKTTQQSDSTTEPVTAPEQQDIEHLTNSNKDQS